MIGMCHSAQMRPVTSTGRGTSACTSRVSMYPCRPSSSPRANSGFGLAGMRERAGLIGAVFHAGPTASGGWQVRLVLPVDAAVNAAPSEGES